MHHVNVEIMLSFQAVIQKLNEFWGEQGCAVIPTCTNEVGAATFHPATIFNCISNNLAKIGLAYVQPCVRPADNRGGVSKNRLYQHHQYQVLIKPVPNNIQDLYIESLRCLSIPSEENDIRFVEDNWENPSIGAYGLGWEIQLNGMEITQFTYMQQVGGVPCPTTPVEIAYGLERLTMLIQGKDNVYDVAWDDRGLTYGDIFLENERQFAAYLSRDDNNPEVSQQNAIMHDLHTALSNAERNINSKLPLITYNFCLKASHILNVLDAKGALGYNDRASYILTIKNLVNGACKLWNDGACAALQH